MCLTSNYQQTHAARLPYYQSAALMYLKFVYLWRALTGISITGILVLRAVQDLYQDQVSRRACVSLGIGAT